MARSEAAISILQFDDAALTHLAATPAGDAFQIEDCATQPVDGPLAPDALRRFAEARDVACSRLYTILPRHEVTVRLLTLPAREPVEIASMVELTAGEFAPYPRESLVIRHQVLEALPSGESRVLLVLAHQDAIDRHVALLQGAGLEPQQIFLSTSCLQAAAMAVPDMPSGPFAVVHLSAAAVEVAVIDGGALRFSRGVTHDGPWDLSDRHGRESLAYEVRDALSAFRREREDGVGVSTLLVSAEGSPPAELVALLEEATEKPCLPAPTGMDLVVNPVALQGVCPLAGLGALLASEGRAPLAITLLPESLARDRVLRGVQRRVLRVAVLAGVVLAAFGAWFAQAVVQRVLLIRELRTQVEALAPSAEGVAAKQRSLQIISRQVDQDGGFLDLLSAVASAAPASEFNFTRIEYDREEGMNLWGRARSKDLVLSEFLGNLRRLGEGSLAMLAHAHSQYETAGRERNETVYNYHVAIPALQDEELDGRASTDR